MYVGIFEYLCLCSHEASFACRHVFAKGFPMYFDCAERRSCLSVARHGSLRIVQSPERLQVLYRLSAADRVSAEAGLLTCKVLAASSSKDGKSKFLRMMFASQAAAAKANILFDTGAFANFVSKAFAKQMGITIKPVDYSVNVLQMIR
jgi:hypothetical protein